MEHPDYVDGDEDGDDMLSLHMMVLDRLVDVIAATFCGAVMVGLIVNCGLGIQMMLVAQMMMEVGEVLRYCRLVEVGGYSFQDNDDALMVCVMMRLMILNALLYDYLTCDFHRGACEVVLTLAKHLIASLV